MMATSSQNMVTTENATYLSISGEFALPAGRMLSSDKFPPRVLDLGAWPVPIWVPALINFYGCEHFDILWQTTEAAGAVEREGCKRKTVYIFPSAGAVHKTAARILTKRKIRFTRTASSPTPRLSCHPAPDHPLEVLMMP